MHFHYANSAKKIKMKVNPLAHIIARGLLGYLKILF